MAGLNLRRRFVMPSPPPLPPSPAIAASSPTGSSSSDGMATGSIVAISVAACGGSAILAALASLFVVWRARTRRGLFGQVKAPGAGPDTTLVVTDVEGSTTLW